MNTFQKHIKSIPSLRSLILLILLSSFLSLFSLSTVCFSQVQATQPAKSPTDHPPLIAQEHMIYFDRAYEHQAKQIQSSLIKSIQETQSQIQSVFAQDFEPKSLKIFLTGSTQEMLDLAMDRQGGHPPEWADGLAYPSSSEIYLVAKNLQQLQTTLKHELIHIALHQTDPHRSMPRWLNEGLSIYLSEGIPWERGILLNEAALKKKLLPFATIESAFPKYGNSASLAYAQSAHFVQYLLNQYGHDKFAKFIANLVQSGDLNSAMSQKVAFDQTAIQIEADWRSQLSQHWIFKWLSFFEESILWGLGIALFVIGGQIKLNQRRRKLEKLRQKEHKEDELQAMWLKEFLDDQKF